MSSNARAAAKDTMPRHTAISCIVVSDARHQSGEPLSRLQIPHCHCDVDNRLGADFWNCRTPNVLYTENAISHYRRDPIALLYIRIRPRRRIGFETNSWEQGSELHSDRLKGQWGGRDSMLHRHRSEKATLYGCRKV